MIRQKALVLDHQILLGAVLPDKPILPLLEHYEDQVDFIAPDVCFKIAERALKQRLERKGLDSSTVPAAFSQLAYLIQPIDVEVYKDFEAAAQARLVGGDSEQWPVVAVALLFVSPVWTQQGDFLGVGVPIWTTPTVEIYMKS
jgi:predicted nucleic acid-binding protein